jgi:hypothetical protein
VREKDGMRIPHNVRMVVCTPPVDLETFAENTEIKENINGVEDRVLT